MRRALCLLASPIVPAIAAFAALAAPARLYAEVGIPIVCDDPHVLACDGLQAQSVCHDDAGVEGVCVPSSCRPDDGGAYVSALWCAPQQPDSGGVDDSGASEDSGSPEKEGGSEPELDASPARDASPSEAGAPAASGSSSGGGCAVGSGSEEAFSALALGAIVVLAGARRRRRR